MCPSMEAKAFPRPPWPGEQRRFTATPQPGESEGRVSVARTKPQAQDGLRGHGAPLSALRARGGEPRLPRRFPSVRPDQRFSEVRSRGASRDCAQEGPRGVWRPRRPFCEPAAILRAAILCRFPGGHGGRPFCELEAGEALRWRPQLPPPFVPVRPRRGRPGLFT